MKKSEMVKELIIVTIIKIICVVLLNTAHSKMSKWFEENTAYNKESKTLKYIAE